nr:hypothetical protein CFP56_76576 [Quercus suber]
MATRAMLKLQHGHQWSNGRGRLCPVSTNPCIRVIEALESESRSGHGSCLNRTPRVTRGFAPPWRPIRRPKSRVKSSAQMGHIRRTLGRYTMWSCQRSPGSV